MAGDIRTKNSPNSKHELWDHILVILIAFIFSMVRRQNIKVFSVHLVNKLDKKENIYNYFNFYTYYKQNMLDYHNLFLKINNVIWDNSMSHIIENYAKI